MRGASGRLPLQNLIRTISLEVLNVWGIACVDARAGERCRLSEANPGPAPRCGWKRSRCADPDGHGISVESIRRVMDRRDRANEETADVTPEPASLLPAIKG